MIYPVNIQEYRHRIELLNSDSSTQNEIGEDTPSLTLFKKVWASIEHLNRNYYALENPLEDYEYYLIKIRYQTDITDSLLVRFQDRIFTIKTVINDKFRNRELHLICYEKVKS
jgi:SPP1 family predicted phage head-tail adaptor